MPTLAISAGEFNSIIKKLILELSILYPSDTTIRQIKKRIFLIIDIDPIRIIDIVGPYLYKYREKIYAGDSDFFTKNDYDAELNYAEDIEKANIAAYIIQKVKIAWVKSDFDQKESYKNIIQTLLDIYLEYLILNH